VTARQLRARLNRLTPPATAVIGQDRDRDRRRREELSSRKLSPTGLTELETAEYMKLDALFREEDRDHDRLLELSFKQFYAEIGRDRMTEEEVQELDSLNLRYPPDPNDPLAPGSEHIPPCDNLCCDTPCHRSHSALFPGPFVAVERRDLAVDPVPL
jgi:hypothetical protein